MKTYEELNQMSMTELKEIKESVMEEIHEARKEKDRRIGEILYLQDMLTKERL